MLRVVSIVAMLAAPGCVNTFADATQDVNREFTLAQQLRDRCNSTSDVDYCLAWRNFLEGRSMPAWEYERSLDRWIAQGPY